ncbi:FkbM family methyltransferase [Ancylothrix sp. D3o]|uniref:FkbM family methyltransferase n=1 Tax=Ancylothrix sp. D3o TaxID=2953691 RepID=UPI0021BB4AD0|nr:FkbM family methyltransferase [Ancylothrix sp. D3o]
MDDPNKKNISNKFLRRVKRYFSHKKTSLLKKLFSYKAKQGKPIRYKLAGQNIIYLYPEGQIAELLYTCTFEQTEIQLVSAYLKAGMKVVDVGANIGLYSILASKIIGENGKIWAFEPSSETHKRLIANLSLNQVSGVEVIKMGLADVEDVLTLMRPSGYRDGDRYLVPKIYDTTHFQQDSGDTESVPVITLDNYMIQNNTELPKVDLMKIDIEGGEYAVFKGAQKVLTANPNILVMFECTPEGCQRAGHTQENVFQFLRQLGFEVYSWNRTEGKWDTSEGLLRSSGNVWACRNKAILPQPR